MNLRRYKKYFKFIKRKPFLILSVTKSIVAAWIFKKSILRKLELSITYKCQCSCQKCSSSKLKNSELKELTLDEIRSIAAQAYSLGIFQVNLIGGEPLLRKDLIEIIKCFKVKKTFISISTNGVLLDEQKIKELKKAGLDYIKISLDSPLEAEHDQKRGWPGLFKKIMCSLEFIKSEGLLYELSTVVTKESITSGKIWELVAMAQEKEGILGLVVPAVCGGWAQDYGVLLGEEERGTLKKLVQYPHVIRDTQTGLFRSQCSAGREQVYITTYGDVLPCSVVQISFGNIRRDSLKSIWAKIRDLGMFNQSKDLCLAGEDKEFIDKYLKPIDNFEQMPVLWEKLKNF